MGNARGSGVCNLPIDGQVDSTGRKATVAVMLVAGPGIRRAFRPIHEMVQIAYRPVHGRTSWQPHKNGSHEDPLHRSGATAPCSHSRRRSTECPRNRRDLGVSFQQVVHSTSLDEAELVESSTEQGAEWTSIRMRA